jgi:acyl-CoA thioesterase 8
MEDLLKLRQVGTDTFVAVERPWLPPAAPSIYGGTMIAQSILAAKATVPDQDMRLASLHCTFIEGGKPQPSIYYAVERANVHTVRRVRAFQEMKCIFIAALRFEHQSQPHPGPPLLASKQMALHLAESGCIKGGGGAEDCPFICSDLNVPTQSSNSSSPDVRILQQMKTRQSMAKDDRTLHIAAVAYMSDNYFLPTVTRVHGIRWERDPESLPVTLSVRRTEDDTKKVKMMVTLDHSMYFMETHEDWRADQWLRAEMHSPWAGDGRGLVVQRIFSDHGTLTCTALQEVNYHRHKISSPRAPSVDNAVRDLTFD